MNKYQAKRQSLLNEMSKIDRMQRGKLSEDYIENKLNGETRRNGPYYKHQQWLNGKNVTRRVKPDEAEQLRTNIEGMDRFKKLSEEFIDATVAMTEEAHDEDSKKNSV